MNTEQEATNNCEVAFLKFHETWKFYLGKDLSHIFSIEWIWIGYTDV